MFFPSGLLRIKAPCLLGPQQHITILQKYNIFVVALSSDKLISSSVLTIDPQDGYFNQALHCYLYYHKDIADM